MGTEGRDAEKEEAAKVSPEEEKLQQAILHHMAIWSYLEVSLSRLFQCILNLRDSAIPYVIYYTPNGFDARTRIVANTMDRFIAERTELAPLKEPWGKIVTELGKAREVRNVIAHGAITKLTIRGKTHARHCPPPFDFIRVLKDIHKGSIPGLSANQINSSYKDVRRIKGCIDAITLNINVFHEHGPQAFQEIFPRSETRLQKFLNYSPTVRKPKGHVAPPQSSSE